MGKKVSDSPKVSAPRERKPYSRERIEAEAAKSYARNGLGGLSADARALDKKALRPTVAILAGVYWRLEGETSERSELAKIRNAKTPNGRRSALVAARRSGVRFEILAGSLGAALGRKVSVAEIRTLLAAGGVDPDASYTGRGTRRSRAGEATRTEERSA